MLNYSDHNKNKGTKMISVNYADADSYLKHKCQEFKNRIDRTPLDEESHKLVINYLALVAGGCFAEAEVQFKSLQGRVDPIILREAAKIQDAAKPILSLYLDGQRRIELAKTEPAEGPRLANWLAIHFNELNFAAATGDRGNVKEAMWKIFHMQKKLLEANGGMEAAIRLSQLCDARIEEIDPDQSLRREINTWSGWLKAGAVNVAKPLAGLALMGGGWYVLSSLKVAIFSTIESTVGTEISQATVIGMAAMGVFRSMRATSLLRVTISGYFLYNQVMALQLQDPLKGTTT
jgi:hypothetical protein